MNIPAVYTLDETLPSKELLHEAYELAKAVCDLSPWDRMDERQVLAIHFADGAHGVISVMGAQGTRRAIALFPSFASFMRIRSVDEGDEQSVMDAFFSVYQQQLVFAPASELKDGEMRDVKASGVKFKRGMNPSFVTYVPGYIDDRMGGEELSRYVRFLRAFLAFFEHHCPDAISLNDAPNKLLTTWEEDRSGDWSVGENDYSPMMPIAVNVDDNLIERVAALPVSEEPMCMEFAAFPIPMGRAPNGRGKISRCVLAVEGETRYAMGFEFIETPDGRELDWTPIVEFGLKTMLKSGKRPTHLAAFGCGLHCVLKALTIQYFKGTEFMSFNPCDAAHEVFSMILARM